MPWLDVHYQPFAQQLVAKAFAQNRLPHAYIFHGPDGVGKKRFAVALGQVLLCSQPTVHSKDATPEQDDTPECPVGCAACEDCRAVDSLSHPDLHMVHRYLNREHPDPAVRKRKAFDLSVDIIRHFVIDRVCLTPVRERYKVFIIEEADRMSVGAQNALLKTLEEPFGATLVILLTQSTSKLLATTLSRCQTVRFDKLPSMFVRDSLAKACPDLSPQQTQWYAEMSGGSLGDAINYAHNGWYELAQSLADRLANLETRYADVAATWTDHAKNLADGYHERDPDISDSEATRLGYKAVLRLTATWFDGLMRASAGAPPQGDEVFSYNAGLHPGNRSTPLMSSTAIERIVTAERHLDQNANVQLCLETLLADLCAIVRGEVRASSQLV